MLKGSSKKFKSIRIPWTLRSCSLRPPPASPRLTPPACLPTPFHVLSVLLLLADQEDDLAPVLHGHAEVEGLPAPQGVQRGGLRDQIS